MSQENRWYDCVDDEGNALDSMASSVKGVADALIEEQEARRMKYVAGLAKYEGILVSDSDPGSLNHGAYTDDTYNLTRSVIATAQAEIAARQRPKPEFLTSSGEWKDRRKAKKLTHFVEAQMSESQGAYEDVWQLNQDVFVDACMPGYGTGFVKVSADTQLERVVYERVLPYEILMDPEEWKYRNGQNLFHTYTISRDLLRDMYGVSGDPETLDDEQRAIQAAIDAAHRDDRLTTQNRRRVTDMVRVYEAWRLPYGDRPGAHCICIASKVLFFEPWERKRFPFAMIQWAPEREGPWGRGLADEVRPTHELVNDAALRLGERMRECTNTYIFEHAGSKADREALSSNDNLRIVTYAGNTPPVFNPCPPPSPAEFQYIADGIQRGYQFSGVSQMSATSQKDPGLTAAVAIRTMNDVQAGRFLAVGRRFEQMHATEGELTIDAVKELGNITAKWPGKKFLRTIKWSEVKMGEDLYTVHVAASSMLSRDLGTRLQTAQELFESGIVTQTQFLQLMQLPDLDTLMERDTAELDYVEMILDRYLDSETYDDLEEAGGYEVPDPSIGDKMAAIALTKNTLFEAKRDGAPELALMLLRRYLREMTALVARPEPPMDPNALPAPAGAPPIPPGGMGPAGPLPLGGPVAGGALPMPGPPPGVPVQ